MTINDFKWKWREIIHNTPKMFLKVNVKLIWVLLLLFRYVLLTAPAQVGSKNPVKFGLLVQSEKSVDAVNGAKLAVEVINGKGGVNGRPVELVVKSMEGPWGIGSKQAVNVIFDDNVLAVIGSTDGRNGHLVEQACTKTGILFISCLAADPTLAQAFVPWFFNCVPNDLQQAQILAEDIFIKNKFNKITVITCRDYDSQGSLRYFKQIYTQYPQGKSADIRIFNNIDSKAFNINEIIGNMPDCILLFCSSGVAADITDKLKKSDSRVPVYGNLYIALSEPEFVPRIVRSVQGLKVPFVVRTEKTHLWFCDIFKSRYGMDPGLSAELTFDAVSLLAEAARKSVHDRESLQNYLMKTRYEGVTGVISFDERGNRRGPFKILNF